jgi:hypothetical protein
MSINEKKLKDSNMITITTRPKYDFESMRPNRLDFIQHIRPMSMPGYGKSSMIARIASLSYYGDELVKTELLIGNKELYKKYSDNKYFCVDDKTIVKYFKQHVGTTPNKDVLILEDIDVLENRPIRNDNVYISEIQSFSL